TIEREPSERLAQFLLDFREEVVEAPGVQHVLEPGLLAVGAVARLNEHSDDRRGDGDAFLGREQDARIAGEVAVPGEPPTARRKYTPGGTEPSAAPSGTRMAWKPMSLVSSRLETRPPPSKAMLNLRGRPYISRWLRM